MVTGVAESWYHEKQSAWLYGVVATAEPDPAKRALFGKLAAAAESQAACWLATRPKHEQQLLCTPALRARIVARLVLKLGPRRLRGVLAAMKLRGLSVYSGSHAPGPHPMPTTVAEVGKRHASAGGNLRAAVFDPDNLGSPVAAAGASFLSFASGATIPLIPFFVGSGGMQAIYASAGVTALMLFAIGIALSLFTGRGAFRGGLRMLLIGGGAGIAAWGIGKLLGASIA